MRETKGVFFYDMTAWGSFLLLGEIPRVCSLRADLPSFGYPPTHPFSRHLVHPLLQPALRVLIRSEFPLSTSRASFPSSFFFHPSLWGGSLSPSWIYKGAFLFLLRDFFLFSPFFISFSSFFFPAMVFQTFNVLGFPRKDFFLFLYLPFSSFQYGCQRIWTNKNCNEF